MAGISDPAGRGVGTPAVWAALESVLPDPPAAVLDLGGGTGGYAVPLAERGHQVVVVDPNPDALAALQRRAAERGVVVTGVQGDVSTLSTLVPAASQNLVLCHELLGVVDDPGAALQAVASVLHPYGTTSILAANRTAAVLQRAVAGHLDQALALLDGPDGRWGDDDTVRRRFTPEQLVSLVTEAGLRVVAVHATRVFSDLVPSQLVDGPDAARVLQRLELRATDRPELLSAASRVHILARRC